MTAFVQARWFTPTARRAIDYIAIHDMEYPERLTAAEDVANYFARGTARASAHRCFDADSQVQCVRDHDVAWHAPGVNHNGLGYEHAGYAAQRAVDWADDFSSKMLAISAKQCALDCTTYRIPMVFVNAAGLQQGYRGITTHWEVSKAFHKTNHTDPGANFPMAHYLDLVRAVASPVIPQEVRPVVNAPVVSILSHPSWAGGYIEVGADGGTFSWGAPNHGSAGAVKLNSPVSCAAVSPSGGGYWLVAQDGGVFAYGDAGFHGSMGGKPLAKPIVAITPTATGAGYWMVGSDGGVFSFGDATYKGSVEFRG